jgi:hypothetical protein
LGRSQFSRGDVSSPGAAPVLARAELVLQGDEQPVRQGAASFTKGNNQKISLKLTFKAIFTVFPIVLSIEKLSFEK